MNSLIINDGIIVQWEMQEMTFGPMRLKVDHQITLFVGKFDEIWVGFVFLLNRVPVPTCAISAAKVPADHPSLISAIASEPGPDLVTHLNHCQEYEKMNFYLHMACTA